MRRSPAIGILLGGVLLWTLLLGQARESVFWRVPLLDELYYLDRATEIQADGPFGDDPYFMSPLYPLLIAATGRTPVVSAPGLIPVGGALGIRLLQIACWFGVVLLLRRIAGRTLVAARPPGVAREVLAWLPSLLFFFYLPAAIYTLSVLVEMPLLLLSTWALDLMTPGADEKPVRRPWLIALGLGAALSLAGLLRGSALVLLPAAVWSLSGPKAGRRSGALATVVLLAAVLVILAPAAIHNSRLAGRPAGPTLNGGLNLAIGNHEGANGFYSDLAGGDWRNDPAGTAALARRDGGAEPTVPEADARWLRIALATMRDDPGHTVGLFLRKAWLHLQGWEIDQLAPLAGWRQEAPALRILAVPWRLLVVLGMTGAVLLLLPAGGDGLPRAALRRWTLVLALLIAGQSLFFVVSRYRLALVPVLCLLGGAAVTAALERRPGGRRERTTVLAAALVALVLTQPWGLGSIREQWRYQGLANRAHRWAVLAEGEDSVPAARRAELLYLEAVRADTTRPDWWLGLALVQSAQGEQVEAEATLDEGIDLHPGDLDLQRELLNILLAAGRSDEALARAEALLHDHPHDADTMHNTVILLANTGRPAGALELAQELIEAHPGDARGYVDAGILLARSGRRDEAREIFERGLEAIPGHPDLVKNLSLLR